MLDPQKKSHTGSFGVLFQNALKYYNAGEIHQCITCCDIILKSDPINHEVCNLLGLALFADGKVEQSLGMLQKAYMLSRREDYLINTAEILRRCYKPNEALALLKTVKNQHTQNFLFNLAKVYTDLQDTQKAIECYEKLIQETPHDYEVLFNLANLIVETNKERAEELYNKSYQLGLTEAGINLASLLCKHDRIEESLQLYKSIESAHKNRNSDSFYFNYANALAKESFVNKALFKQAKAYYKKAIKIKNHPFYSINYSQMLLRFGFFKEGFKYAEDRLALDIIPQILKDYMLHSHDNIQDKDILIFHEQGYGDTLMYARFIPLFAKKCRSIKVIVQEPLLPLFNDSFLYMPKNVEFYSKIPQDGFSHAISLLSLPYFLKISRRDEIISMLPPIQTNKKNRYTRIGIFWKSNFQSPLQRHKSIALSLLLYSLKSLKRCCCFYALQPDCDNNEIALLKKSKIDNLGSHFKNFLDTKEALQELDGLITVDSAIAHLAASMGMPTFLLLHKYHDWRFSTLEGENLFYRNNLYCIRQDIQYHWEKPLEELQKVLKDI